ncbi:sugar kinase [Pelagibacterium lentulum]|uniref:2-dehydro-3-deoxygluconokinase n=1 Tax=Pelagibacterium lentulum TaxID=2029865 RepID=A0A916W3G9_9HYPH|nr:sugar kinase [Pelagibacterium lentulum]GGA62919.1 2-dehydro-3-deoxygluconokinase [Pelagibacterium lentulum]
MGRIVSIGECMVELSGGEGGMYRLGFAGDTLNSAYYLKARLGENWQVDYFTSVGDDLYSSQMVDHIGKCGIGTGHIARLKGKRAGLYMIHQAEGDRHFTYWRDTSAAKTLADDPARLETALDGADVIYFSGITLAILSDAARQTLLAAIGDKRERGVKVCFDPNIRPALWASKDAVRAALMAAARVSTIVLPTHEDEVPYFEDANARATLERYMDAGVSEVVVKNGSDPALIGADGQLFEVSASNVETVVDATGAGDSFNGGYIAARLNGVDPEAAGKAGHATAAIVIGHHGALVPRDVLG